MVAITPQSGSTDPVDRTRAGGLLREGPSTRTSRPSRRGDDEDGPTGTPARRTTWDRVRPANVAIHAISASLKLGDPRTAAETGEALDPAAMPAALVARRTQVNLDLARAYAMTRKDAAAVNLLLAAERLSRQLVRYDPATLDVLTELLRREHLTRSERTGRNPGDTPKPGVYPGM
jgi:hypothetical protein